MTEFTIEALAKAVDGNIEGDATYTINGVGTLASATKSQLTFLANKAYRNQLETCQAGAVILKQADLAYCKTNSIIVDDPMVAYAMIAAIMFPVDAPAAGISASASVHAGAQVDPSASIGHACVIEEGCRIGANVVIGPGCHLGKNVTLDDDVRLAANVSVLHDCHIGKRSLLHSGAVVGTEGFGFANAKGKWIKVPQVGRVIVGDDVEIGANTAIDRGAIEDTIIANGVKLDNLIHIAHNVRIGENTAIAACTGIAGSTTIGKNCMIAGQVGISGHISITDNVILTGRATVLQSITEPGIYSSCAPLTDNRTWHKNYMSMKKIHDMSKKLKALENEILELEEKLAKRPDSE